jgi:hypothetical protein
VLLAEAAKSIKPSILQAIKEGMPLEEDDDDEGLVSGKGGWL